MLKLPLKTTPDVTESEESTEFVQQKQIITRILDKVLEEFESVGLNFARCRESCSTFESDSSYPSTNPDRICFSDVSSQYETSSNNDQFERKLNSCDQKFPVTIDKEVLEKRIEDLRKQIEKQDEVLKNKLNQKFIKIEELKQNRDSVKTSISESINEIIIQNEKNMLLECRRTQPELDQFVELVLTEEANYETALETNIKEMNILVREKFKRKEILENRLKRYDKDVLEKTIEAIDLQKELDTLREAYESSHDAFKNQTPLYEEMMKEQYNELLERIEPIRRNNAAKVIQRHYRSYLKEKRMKQSQKGHRKMKKQKI